MCPLVMIAENVSLGILSIPSTIAVLGMVPYVSRNYQLLHFYMAYADS